MAGAAKTGAAADARAGLYERDYYAWILDQVRALRERRTGEIDWENVAEEIEDLGKSERRALQSHMARLLEHLLKLAYAPSGMKARNRRGWELSAEGARNRIRDLLDESPSLRAKADAVFAKAYRDGRLDALSGLRLPRSAVPESPRWSFEQAMDNDFLPAPADAE
jgi:hypothetical protein